VGENLRRARDLRPARPDLRRERTIQHPLRSSAAVKHARQASQTIGWRCVRYGKCTTKLDRPLIGIGRRDVRMAVKPTDQRRRILRPPAVQIAAQQHRGQSPEPVERPQHVLLPRGGRISHRELPDNDDQLGVCRGDPPSIGMLATLEPSDRLNHGR